MLSIIHMVGLDDALGRPPGGLRQTKHPTTKFPPIHTRTHHHAPPRLQPPRRERPAAAAPITIAPAPLPLLPRAEEAVAADERKKGEEEDARKEHRYGENA